MVPDSQLLQRLTPETRVLVWTHSGPLTLATPGLETVDYLLDGLVTGHVKAHSEAPSHHVIFSHSHYGQSFWVGFVDVKHANPQAFMNALKSVLPADAQATTVVYGETSGDWDKALRGQFRHIEHFAI